MALGLSARHSYVMQSEIRNMSIECDRVGGINLSQGVCDTAIPLAVRDGARQAIESGINTYTHYAGLSELRGAIAAKQMAFYGMEVDPDTEIIVSGGATGALYCACLALLNPGDEVILFEPFYGYHVQTLLATQVVPVYVRMRLPGWTFSIEDLEAVVTRRTRAIIVNTPANPSGKVFSIDTLNLLAAFAKRHDLFVFTDEIYEHFIYGDGLHIPLGTLPGMKERTITISGLSKTFSITGWRIGYCICDARWTTTIGFFSDLVYVCAPAPLQFGVARGLRELDRDYYDELSRMYRTKRDKICDALARVELAPNVPDGAYYVLADISTLPGKDSKERAMYLLGRTGVACVPGEAFYHGDGGRDLARFCYAKDDDVLDDACRRLERLRG